ncbi:hypothetical protein GCM10009805_14150 [Leucobacter chromiireducens subsp. solipictus]
MTRPPGTWRLLAPALVSWALVAGAVNVPGSGVLVACGGVLVGASALGIAAVRRRRAGALRPGTSGGGASSERAGLTDHSLLGPVLLLAGLVIALGVRMESVDRARSAPGLRVAADHGTPISLTVTVTSYPGIDRNGQPWMSARTEQPSGPAPVVVWCGAPEDTAGSGASGPKPRDRTRAPPSSRCGGSGWGPGSSVTLIGEVAALDPGGSAAWGIRVHEVQAVRGGSRAAAGAARLREGLRAAAVATPGAELVPGLAVGDTTLVSPDTDQQMRDASLTHLVAVSGETNRQTDESGNYPASAKSEVSRAALEVLTHEPDNRAFCSRGERRSCGSLLHSPPLNRVEDEGLRVERKRMYGGVREHLINELVNGWDFCKGRQCLHR